VLLGVCTGSVACGAALKIMLMHYGQTKSGEGKPVIVALDGNYHGTDMVAQRLRGMWPEFVRNIEPVMVQPNNRGELEQVFRRFGRRIAGFWAEPIMMNREAILIDRGYLRLARKLCNQVDACMVLDEIQTGFWWPEVLMFPQFGIVPDVVVVGKGMTAGFHPLSGIIYKRKYDCLAQYDAISTNGNAALAALVGLACIDLIERHREQVGELGRHYFERLQAIPERYPDRVSAIHGKGLMAGLKFRDVKDALAFHKRCVGNGLWVRAHAYHAGHSTVLTKLGLCFDRQTADFVVDKLIEALGQG
jgi:acetylornithine/succinyldiaminopimelate/putrescine aminotransferase